MQIKALFCTDQISISYIIQHIYIVTQLSQIYNTKSKNSRIIQRPVKIVWTVVGLQFLLFYFR